AVGLEQAHQEEVGHAYGPFVAAMRKGCPLAGDDRRDLVEEVGRNSSRFVNHSRHANHYADTKLCWHPPGAVSPGRGAAVCDRRPTPVPGDAAASWGLPVRAAEPRS